MPRGDSLQVVANFGVGYENIDLDAARRRNVRVTNTPGVLSAATAELAVTLMLAAARRVAEGDEIVRAGKWDAHGADTFLGRNLVGATVGLVGFGRIGQTVARLLSGFDVRIVVRRRGRRGDRPAGRSGCISTSCSRSLTSSACTWHSPRAPGT